jgi:hypothetical protein
VFVRFWIIMFAFSCTSVCAAELNWQNADAVTEIFEIAKLEGTFVLYDAQTKTYTGHNLARAKQQYYPASTFKVPNTQAPPRIWMKCCPTEASRNRFPLGKKI